MLRQKDTGAQKNLIRILSSLYQGLKKKHLAKIQMKQIGTDAINEAIASQGAKGEDLQQIIDYVYE
ncbi:MAG: hypothetical protein LBJ26_02165 [Paenibacillus sp.]|jgi:hypothetical protein|nr:hypothetical protein [Paenibacillus sp.]